jgi:hypothetical protein
MLETRRDSTLRKAGSGLLFCEPGVGTAICGLHTDTRDRYAAYGVFRGCKVTIPEDCAETYTDEE